MQVINNIWSISRPRHDVLFMWRRIRVHGVIAFVSRWEESSWITLSDTHSPIQTAVSVGETRHAPTQQCTLWRRFGLVWGSVWNFFCFLPWDYTRKNVFFMSEIRDWTSYCLLCRPRGNNCTNIVESMFPCLF